MKHSLTLDQVIGQLKGVRRYLDIGRDKVVEVNREGVINILNETIEFLESVKPPRVSKKLIAFLESQKEKKV